MEIACVDIEPRVCKVCEPGVESGNVIAVVFVKNDRKITDYFDDFTWLTLDYKAQAIFVHKTRGTFTSEPIQTPGYGQDGEITIGYNHTLSYSEPFDCRLRKHYEGLQKSSEYRAIFLTDKGIRDGGAVAKVSVDTPVGEVGTILEYVVTVTWTSDGLIPCESGTPPGLLTDCALFERLKLIFCPPTTPACVEQGEILDTYGNDVYPGTPGQFEVDYTFEDVPSYPMVALQQTQPSQLFFDTFDVVENGVIIGSADPARLGITGINSMADLVAATPLSVSNQSQWAMKYDLSNSYRVTTWYNNGIGGGEGIFKTVKVYVRGFAQFRLHLFCAPAIFTPDAFLLPFEPKNVYVVSEATRVCLCPKLTVAPLTSALLLDGLPAPSFQEIEPDTIYVYSLTGNFIDAEWQRKVCCGFPSVMFVFIGSSTIVLSASNVGPVVLDGVTFTYDPLTFTVTVETPADVSGINFTAVASLENCEAVNYAFGLGECQPVTVQWIPQSETDPAGYLTANPNVNAVIQVSASGTGVSYIGTLYDYEWERPQTDTMVINANIFAPLDRYPSPECCASPPPYDPDFVSGSTIEFTITPVCGGSPVTVTSASTTASAANYDFTWQTGIGGSVDLIIENTLAPGENDCDLEIVASAEYCGTTLNRLINVDTVSSCNNNIDFIEPFQGPAATYLAANPGVDAVFEYTPLNQLVYVGTNQYTWNSDTNNALLRCVLSQQPGDPLSCCADYASIVAGETGSFIINSPCLTGPVTVDFANPVVGDSGFTFVYNNGAGYFALVMINDNAPTQAGPCVFAITSCVNFCSTENTCNTGPVVTVT